MLLVGRYNDWPWVGVRSRGGEAAKEQWSGLRRDLQDARRNLHATSSDPWPLWRYVTPPSDADGVDVERFLRQLLVELREVWDGTEAIIDAYFARRL